MLLPIYATAIIAALFYVLLPGFFALRLGTRWHGFRDRIRSLGSVPVLDYAAMAKAREEGAAENAVWRIDGCVEAIEGADRLWLRSPSVSVVIDFSDSPIYVLAHRSSDLPYDSIERAGSVQRLRWEQVRSLPEGTRLFAAGPVSFSGSAPVFHGGGVCPLVAVLHDESPESFFPAMLAGARSRNELWGRSTFLAWALGVFMSSLASVWTGGVATLDSIRFMSWLVALSPLLPFVPPGTAFLFLARRIWRESLLGRMRSEREAGYAKAESEDGEPGRLPPLVPAFLAVGCAAIAYALNLVLAFLAWRLLA